MGFYEKEKGMLRTHWIRVLIAIILSTVLILPACSKVTTSSKYLRGFVFSEKPISGATLTVYDTKGKVIKQSQEMATSDFGTFLLEVNHLPSDFRVVSSKGMMDGQVFTAELKADYRGFNPETDIVYIDTATTLVSTYLDKHPDKTVDEATQIIKRYLEMPEVMNNGQRGIL